MSHAPVRLAVSIGCPAGIGPEIALLAAACAARDHGIASMLIGDPSVLHRAALLRGFPLEHLAPIANPSEWTPSLTPIVHYCPTPSLALSDAAPGHPSDASGHAQLAWIEAATDLVARGVADAIVTGPVSKEVIARAGHPFIGHTEHIAARLGAPAPIMIFVTPTLSVALATTHIRLLDVAAQLSPARVHEATFRLAELLACMGVRPARIAVAALNPHAGEHGLFGDEEARILSPGMQTARTHIASLAIEARIDGPVGAETAFRLAFDGHYDGVVAMYHDQGTIPLKVRSFGEAVNVTAGLPIIRTSVDHGTGYDIAGTAKASPASMLEAMVLAAKLVRAKTA